LVSATAAGRPRSDSPEDIVGDTVALAVDGDRLESVGVSRLCRLPACLAAAILGDRGEIAGLGGPSTARLSVSED
jgi:hypothetical protein